MRKMLERSSGAPSLFTIKAEAPHVLERQQQNAPSHFKPKQSCCMTLRVLVCVYCGAEEFITVVWQTIDGESREKVRHRH